MKFINWIKKIKWFLISLTPMAIYLIIYLLYHALRCWLGMVYLFPVDIVGLYNFEMFLFYFVHFLMKKISNPVFDFTSAFIYFVHFMLPAIYAVVLLINWRRMNKFQHFNYLIGLTSVITVLIEYFLPTAPPWFATNYKNITKDELYKIQCSSISDYIKYMDPNIMSGIFYKVDLYLKHDFFKNIYKKNIIIFGSFPSMHAAWPMCIYYSGAYGKKYGFIGIIHIIWISGAAVYSNHHFIIDILGALIIVISCKFLAKYIVKNTSAREKLNKYQLPDTIQDIRE